MSRLIHEEVINIQENTVYKRLCMYAANAVSRYVRGTVLLFSRLVMYVIIAVES